MLSIQSRPKTVYERNISMDMFYLTARSFIENRNLLAKISSGKEESDRFTYAVTSL